MVSAIHRYFFRHPASGILDFVLTFSFMRHRDWHQALDDLLEEVDKALKSKEKLAETDAPPIFASTDGPEVETKGQGQGEVASELATSDFSNFNAKDWSKAPMENVQVDPPEFSESNKRATRSMSSNSLLRPGAWERKMPCLEVRGCTSPTTCHSYYSYLLSEVHQIHDT